MLTINRAFVLSLLLVCTACATAPPSPEELAAREKAKSVGIVPKISATQIVQFQETGPVECEIYWQNLGEVPEEKCRDELKLKAARLGSDIVVIEGREPFKCKYGIQDDKCVRMKGRAYRKR